MKDYARGNFVNVLAAGSRRAHKLLFNVLFLDAERLHAIGEGLFLGGGKCALCHMQVIITGACGVLRTGAGLIERASFTSPGASMQGAPAQVGLLIRRELPFSGYRQVAGMAEWTQTLVGAAAVEFAVSIDV